jgi:LPS-assembly protein
MMAGPDLKMNMHTNIGEMNHPVFQLNPIMTGKNKQAAARGTAEVLRSTSKLTYEFDNATYTSCPAGNDDWLLNMSSLEIDRGTQIGTAHSAWIEFKGVPLLYTPWMNFPLDGRRLSGFLSPTYGTTSSSGMELTVPIYLNLAPNYDATISPRIMSKRGTLLNNEFRFMSPSYAGELHYDFLKNDRITNTTRTRTAFTHAQNLGGGFGLSTNFNRVSDDTYFSDLSSSVYGGTQTQLLNEGLLTYGGGWWSASIRGQTYQTLQNAAVPYQRLPQINLSGQQSTGNSLISMTNEYVDFRHPTKVNGQRLLLYPSITYALLSDPGFYLKPKLGVHHTQYLVGYNNTTDIPDTTRTLPIFSMDSGMTFERGITLGDGEYVQTLEPRLFYVNIPYQDQSLLPIYDTSQAPFNFAQMFAENRFIGNDRVGDANMATVAITSRFIDNEGGAERLRVTLGERFSFQAPQVNLVAPSNNNLSDILLAVAGKATNALTLDGLLEYDPNTAHTLSYNATARYKPETGKVLNLGYRYTRVDGLPENDVRQTDFSTQWPLFWHWNAVSRWTYSLNEQRDLEQLVGLEYNQSCWMLRLVTQKFPVPGQKVSTGIFIQLELRDLVALGSDPLNALRLSVPGYSKLGRPAADEATPGLP